jgi:hypothetical protein
MDDESTDIISRAATTLFEMQWPTYEVDNYYNMQLCTFYILQGSSGSNSKQIC